MKNAYEIRGDVTAIFLNSTKHGKMETLISTNKLKRAKEYPNTWFLEWSPSNNGLYCVGKITKNGKRTGIKLHRWITNCPPGLEVDHFNHKTLDNTDGNLRIATRSENLQNLEGAYCTSKSGVRGVNWHRGKWEARIQLNGKRIHVGSFDSIQEAEKSVIKARAENMPFSKEARAVSK